MRITRIVALISGAVLFAGALQVAWASSRPSVPSSSGSTGTGSSIDPKNFVRHVTNPFFPLKPGTLFVYRGQSEGDVEIDRVFVTHRTKRILGVRTTVVRDVVSTPKGLVLERTFDWYAQDRKGTVWYFGENTKSYEGGQVSTEGSWKAGDGGARAGILMEAGPHAPDGYRQEFSAGVAEDQAWVLRKGGTVRVPYGNLRHKLLTMEWTPLEPNVIDKKFYARGVGLVLERSQHGPSETNALVKIRHL